MEQPASAWIVVKVLGDPLDDRGCRMMLAWKRYTQVDPPESKLPGMFQSAEQAY